MRIRFLLATVLAITVAAGVTIRARQQQPPSQTAPPSIEPAKIALLDSRLLDSDEGIQQLLQQIRRVNDSFRERVAAVQKLQQQIESLRRELQTQWAKLTPEARERKQDELDEMQRRYQREAEDLQREMDKAMRMATDPIREKILTALASYAKTRGIALVLDQAALTQAGALAYSDPSLDITRDFIAEYNRANPATR